MTGAIGTYTSTSGSRSGRRAPLWAATLVALACGASPAGAQTLALKRAFPSATAGICPGFTAPPPATPTRVQESRRLFSLGQEASIVGDHRAARDLFRQSQELNGADERTAYYFARSSEELKQTTEAVAQYCRYLAIAPNGAEAADVRNRLERLADPGAATRGGATAGRRTAAAARFQSALAAADRNQAGDAERGFSDVINTLPNAAEAYYNRGVVRARQRDYGGAARDLQTYLSKRPTAEDAPAVRERIAVLRRAAINPSTALAGVVLPGFGQYYTRRPVFGALVTAAAVGGAVYALRESDRTKDTTYTDAFGNPYQGTVTHRGRYGQTTGLAIVGGVAVLGALEGYLYASGRRSAAVRLVASRDGEGASPAPGRSAFAAWMAPTSVRAGDGSRKVAFGAFARMRF